MNSKNTPKGWTPPYPAWEADLSSDVTDVFIVYYGVQYKSGTGIPAVAAQFFETFERSQDKDNAPKNVERGSFIDGQGYQNDIFVCYWSRAELFHQWQENAEISNWLREEGRTKGDAGFWIERHVVPLEKFETNFSSTDALGAAALTEKQMVGPINKHAYWGSMRDRIPLSEKDNFDASEEIHTGPDSDSQGHHIRLSAPDNLCVIRSGQDWSRSKGAERADYLKEIQPVLAEGMAYLIQNPKDSGCMSCRLVSETDRENRPVQKSFGLAYFISLKHLEDWSMKHPSHLKIFQTFHKFVQKYNFEIDLRLWHEVAILDKDNSTFDYINCHNKTGILSFYTSF